MPNLERGRLLNRETIYEGRIFDVVVDHIELKGRKALREVIRHPGGVVILVNHKGKIPFVRQHRYPIGRDLLELPAGKVDRGEKPEVCAARELEEETGLRARILIHVCDFYSSPGFCDELLRFYYSEDVEETQANPEPEELLEQEYYDLEEALRMIARGEIQDGKTITALYWLYFKQQNGAEPTS